MNDAPIPRYPLEWPLGWKRTPSYQRKRANFGKRVASQPGGYRYKESLSVGDGMSRLLGELRRMGVGRITLSSNLRIKTDGLPYSQQAKQLDDPGVAVYFSLRGKALVLACDRWSSAADNMAAIAGHIEGVRASERYGVGTIEQAFAGYKSLPADTAANWRVVLGFPRESQPSRAQIDTAYKALAREKHPDVGGDDASMAHLNRARDYAYAEIAA